MRLCRQPSDSNMTSVEIFKSSYESSQTTRLLYPQHQNRAPMLKLTYSCDSGTFAFATSITNATIVICLGSMVNATEFFHYSPGPLLPPPNEMKGQLTKGLCSL